MKVLAQGDPVQYDVADPADACQFYRRDMTAALIGISTHLTDYERAQRNAESVRLQQGYITQLQDNILRLTAERDGLSSLARDVAYFGEALIQREYEPGSRTVTELVERARSILASLAPGRAVGDKKQE